MMEKENMYKEKINKKNKELELIKKEYEKHLKEKYEQNLQIEIKKIEEQLNQKLEKNKIELETFYEQKIKNKEKELQNKFDQMSSIMQNKINNNASMCKTVHHGIKCKKCFKEPIIGYRYKCSECNNYNLCQDCEEKNAINGDHHHNFIKIRNELKENNNFNDNQFNNNLFNLDKENDNDNNLHFNLNKLNNDIKNNKNDDNENDNDNDNHKIHFNNNNIFNDNNIINNHNIEENNIIKDNDEFNILNDENNENDDNDDNDNNEDEENKEYSYECLNLNKLNKEISEGIDQVKIEIILKNNKNITWPKNNTKLVYDYSSSNFVQDDLILEPQRSNEVKQYNLIIKELDQYPAGEYNIFLWFEVNGKHFGERIEFKIIIKEKDNEEFKKVEDFRVQFNLFNKDEYPDAKLLDLLKKHNFNSELAFMELIN